MELERSLLERVEKYEGLSRWEKSELGRDLRRHGLSYGEIMQLIAVKKSTLATWCREIELTREQIDAIRARTGQVLGVPRDTQRKRRREIALIEALALVRVEELRADPTWAAGVALYWGEGGKTSRRLEMAHSEPEALRLFMTWARRFLNKEASFSATMNLHFDNDEQEAKAFWIAELGVESSDFTKTFIKPDGTGHRKNHLPTGVCRLRMRKSTDAFLMTMVWIDFMKQTLGR